MVPGFNSLWVSKYATNSQQVKNTKMQCLAMQFLTAFRTIPPPQESTVLKTVISQHSSTQEEVNELFKVVTHYTLDVQQLSLNANNGSHHESSSTQM